MPPIRASSNLVQPTAAQLAPEDLLWVLLDEAGQNAAHHFTVAVTPGATSALNHAILADDRVQRIVRPVLSGRPSNDTRFIEYPASGRCWALRGKLTRVLVLVSAAGEGVDFSLLLMAWVNGARRLVWRHDGRIRNEALGAVLTERLMRILRMRWPGLARVNLRDFRRSVWSRIPIPWRGVVLSAYRQVEKAQAKIVRKMTRPPALRSFAPLLPENAFVKRRIVLANSSLTWGGAERQVIYTLQGLSRARVESVALVCIHLTERPEHAFYQGHLTVGDVEVSQLRPDVDSDTILEGVRDRAHLITRYLDQFPSDIADVAFRYVLEFLTRRPAVVHAWQDYCSITAGLAALMVGVPRIVVAGRNLNPTNFDLYRPCMPDIYKVLIKSGRVTFINNSAAGAADYAKWLGLPCRRVKVIRNGIDTDSVRRADDAAVSDYRAQLGIPQRVPVVGGVFRLYPEKRPELWVEAMAHVAKARPDAHFLLVGAGPHADRVRERATSLGIVDRLRMPGTTKDVAVPLSLMDVFVLTSFGEGTPNVLIEAGLLGVPIVATDAGGTRETFDHGRTGWLVEIPDATIIAERVLYVLGNPEWAKQAAILAPEFVRERFGLERMIKETLAVYGH